MATKLLLPKFGQTVESSEINQWLVKEGDAIRKSQVLCEISTDKSALEVESQYEGTLLKILLPTGKAAPVGCVIAVLGAPGEALSAEFLAECLATQRGAPAGTATETAAVAVPAPVVAPAAALAPAPAAPPMPRPAAPTAPAPRPVPAPRPASASTTGGEPPRRHTASPRARRLAERQHVPLALLHGTGEDGRVVEGDVQGYLDAVGAVTPTARALAGVRGVDLRVVRQSVGQARIASEDLARFGLPVVKPSERPDAELPPLVARIEKPSPMRRAIAANMALSASTIPAFQVEITVDAAALIARREADKAAGAKISYGDYLARAVALAIRRFPNFAATWTDTGIQFRDRVHVGFAVAVPGGLVVPVVTDCDVRSPADIAARSAELVDKARAGKLAPDEYSGGIFTLSNLGGFPVDRFVAIVPPGQSGILAIGRIRDELVVRIGPGGVPAFAAAKLLSLTLSADHRIIDGAEGAAFMAELKKLVEQAERL